MVAIHRPGSKSRPYRDDMCPHIRTELNGACGRSAAADNDRNGEGTVRRPTGGEAQAKICRPRPGANV